MNCSAQLCSTRSTVNGDGVHCEKTEGGCQKRTTSSLMYVAMRRRRRERVQVGRKEAQVMRGRNGRGCDRPRPFSIIAILAVVVLTKCRGSTVTSAHVSCCIGIMHWCWGL